jgi:site-specific DNA recombinase
VLGAVAELERAKINERYTRGRLHHVRQGKLASNGYCTYGYVYKRKVGPEPPRLLINEHQAEVVRQIFEMFTEGRGIGYITRSLEQRELPTARGKKMWRPEQIRYLLKNNTYTGVRYFNSMRRVMMPSIKRGSTGYAKAVYRDRSEWIGVKVPAIITQDLFDRVQEKFRQRQQVYRQPLRHHLLGELVVCGECGAGYSSYNRYVTKDLTIGKRRVYHKAAYKCNRRTLQWNHTPQALDRCHNKEIATHLLEDTVFELIRDNVLDEARLRDHIELLKAPTQTDHRPIEAALLRVARELREIDERKRLLIDMYAAGNTSEEAYVNENVALDRRRHELELRKLQLVKGIPVLHQKSIDAAIRQFCHTAKLRFDKTVDFDAKRRFLLDHVERVIYERYKVVVIGSVPVKALGSETGNEPEQVRKLEYRVEGQIDTNDLHRKPRKKFAEDGRLKAFGSGGRRQIPVVPCCSDLKAKYEELLR